MSSMLDEIREKYAPQLRAMLSELAAKYPDAPPAVTMDTNIGKVVISLYPLDPEYYECK